MQFMDVWMIGSKIGIERMDQCLHACTVAELMMLVHVLDAHAYLCLTGIA